MKSRPVVNRGVSRSVQEGLGHKVSQEGGKPERHVCNGRAPKGLCRVNGASRCCFRMCFRLLSVCMDDPSVFSLKYGG